MNRFFPRLLCLALLSGTAFVTGSAIADGAEAGDQQKVVVHLSHFTDDIHACFMAFKVASLMQEEGADVTVFLDMEGVRLAARRQELAFTWGPESPPLSKYYEQFTSKGGKVLLCPHCAKSAHLTDPGLKRNAELATMVALGKLLIDADKVIDY
jgi:predicted peroxiredoxin